MVEINKNTSRQSLTTGEIEAWLVTYISQLFSISSNEIDVNLDIKRYGLDSSSAIALLSDLSEYIRYELNPELLLDYPTIKAIANYCAGIEEVIL
ncbi:acyl carrier protein [Microcoleus sp. D2_18a_D3]|uniref:acyl carrier protein n=1 Tax=Microcoleus sp. D2_18a_D3 TaxID=3055330 RepID=UPI002FD2E079